GIASHEYVPTFLGVIDIRPCWGSADQYAIGIIPAIGLRRWSCKPCVERNGTGDARSIIQYLDPGHLWQYAWSDVHFDRYRIRSTRIRSDQCVCAGGCIEQM